MTQHKRFSPVDRMEPEAHGEKSLGILREHVEACTGSLRDGQQLLRRITELLEVVRIRG